MVRRAVPHSRVPSHRHIHTARLSMGQREGTASLSGCVQLPWSTTSCSMMRVWSDRASRARYPKSSRHGPWCIRMRFSFCSAPLENRAHCLLLPFVPTEPHKKEARDSKMKKKKKRERERERERKPSFLLIQVSRQGLGFFHSPSKNEDRTSATSAVRGAKDAARYRSWNNSNNSGWIY